MPRATFTAADKEYLVAIQVPDRQPATMVIDSKSAGRTKPLFTLDTGPWSGSSLAAFESNICNLPATKVSQLSDSFLLCRARMQKLKTFGPTQFAGFYVAGKLKVAAGLRRAAAVQRIYLNSNNGGFTQ